LNSIIAAHLKDAVCARFTGDTDPSAMAGWLSMALQTQKQCADALKTASTVEYLDAMTGRPNTPSPHAVTNELIRRHNHGPELDE